MSTGCPRAPSRRPHQDSATVRPSTSSGPIRPNRYTGYSPTVTLGRAALPLSAAIVPVNGTRLRRAAGWPLMDGDPEAGAAGPSTTVGARAQWG